MAINQATIEAAVNGHVGSMRNLFNAFRDEIVGMNSYMGRTGSGKIDTVQTSIVPAPPPATLAVSGKDGRVFITITNPQQQNAQTQALLVRGGSGNAANATIFHELSSSPTPAFTSGVTTYPPTTSTVMELSLPNSSLYWRLRSSFDQTTWTSYQVFSGVIAPGGLTSGSTQPNVMLNQSNYATVDSVAAGATPIVRVYGPGGVGTTYPRQVGTLSPLRPGATILNVPYGANGFVAYDTQAEMFHVKQQLPQTFPDQFEPVGAVSVVFAGTPTLPVLKPIFTSGFLVGIQRISDGNGLSAPPTGTVVSSTGHNASFILQITNGKVSGYQITNGGDGLYVTSDTISVSGGISGGVAGGGGVSGGNGGRFYSNPQNLGL